MGNPFESNTVMTGGNAAEKKEELKLLKPGDQVKVLRTSGEVEEDWMLVGFDNQTGNAKVEKRMEDGQFATKEISRVELYALNVPEGSTAKFPVKDWLALYNKESQHHLDKIELPSWASENALLTPEEARGFMERNKSKKNLQGAALLFKGAPEEVEIMKKRREALFS